jgi:glycosyltransferase involved in cell wall biosynthesis
MKIYFHGYDHFLIDIKEYFNVRGKVVATPREADLIWIEWAGLHIIPFTRDFPGKKIVVRLHAYELNSPQVLRQIPWEKVSLLIFISTAKSELFHKLLPNAEVRTIFIPNTINMKKFAFSPRTACSFKLGMLGRIYPNKGILSILLQMRMLDRAWKLTVQGSPLRKHPIYFYNLKLAKAFLGLLKRVEFLPHIDQPQEFYQNHDIIISNSRKEGFHTVIAEGMACGCYPIVKNWPGAETLYPHDQIFTNMRQFRCLVQRYQDFTPEQREEKSWYFRRFVEERYGSEIVIKKLAEELESLKVTT